LTAARRILFAVCETFFIGRVSKKILIVYKSIKNRRSYEGYLQQGHALPENQKAVSV
jgi:hypothetical protein